MHEGDSVEYIYTEVRVLLERLNKEINLTILHGTVEELDALRGMRTHIEDSIDVVREYKNA